MVTRRIEHCGTYNVNRCERVKEYIHTRIFAKYTIVCAWKTDK
jgi:hypothetical protein